MSVRTNWHLDADVPEHSDPFANFVEQPTIPRVVEEVGKPIDLSSTEPQLRRRLIELVNLEASLGHAGTRCEIRDRDDTSCCSCPVRGLDERIVKLCVLGVEQEQVLTTLAVHKIRGRKH